MAGVSAFTAGFRVLSVRTGSPHGPCQLIHSSVSKRSIPGDLCCTNSHCRGRGKQKLLSLGSALTTRKTGLNRSTRSVSGCLFNSFTSQSPPMSSANVTNHKPGLLTSKLKTIDSRLCSGTRTSDSEATMANGVVSEDGPIPSDFLLPYQPADWMKKLRNIPMHRVKLIHGVTPIQRWYLPNVPGDFEIYIKRDDMTGSELSGNKARKLEFLLADAIHQGCSSIITCGSTQSNHCRATAIAARQLGLEPHLLLRSPVSDIAEVTCKANMLLNRLIGAHVHLMPKKAQFNTDIKPRLDQLVQKIKEETGKSAYPIVIGGSSAVGLFGYLQGFAELQQQGVTEKFTDIVIACGSNGSTLGLALANYLTGSRLKVHGMIVSDDSKFHFDGMNAVLREVDARDGNSKALQAEDIVNLVDGVKGLGYGLSTPEELDIVAEICTKTGIIIDPVYTGKSVRHLLRLAKDKPAMFKGNQILFVHTGGIFGLFDGRMDDTVRRHGLEQNRFHEWMELGDRAPDWKL